MSAVNAAFAKHARETTARLIDQMQAHLYEYALVEVHDAMVAAGVTETSFSYGPPEGVWFDPTRADLPEVKAVLDSIDPERRQEIATSGAFDDRAYEYRYSVTLADLEARIRVAFPKYPSL